MPRTGSLTARLTLAFLAVSAVTLAVVLIGIERVTTDSFDAYTRHVEMMQAMTGGTEPLPDAAAFVVRLRWSLLVGAAGGAVVSLVLAVVVARRLARPAHQLREAAERIAEGDTSVRVRTSGTDELAALGSSFNTMAAALARASESRKRFVADVAHELRTPLAVLQGDLEAVQDGLLELDGQRLESLLEETRFLSRLVDDLRTLSLVDAGELRLVRAVTPVRPLIERSVEAVAQQAAMAGVSIGIEASAALPNAYLDDIRIEQVLRNLLSNAVRHTSTGGEVVVRAVEADGALRLCVDDSGSGIPADDLERIFERLYRADPSRSRESGGSGLGLAIARELVEAHGGSICAANRPGGGASLQMTLPTIERQPSTYLRTPGAARREVVTP